MLLSSLALLSIIQCSIAILGFDQSTSVKIILMCNNQPAVGVKVKLYDDDWGPDFDDLMGETTTDFEGRFHVSGYTDEFLTIDPKINIYHDCNDGNTPCQRRITFYIPDEYVSSGETPSITFDFETLQLAAEFPGEERDCLH